MDVDEYQYIWWSKKARQDMAALLTRLGLESCPICDSGTLAMLPWPAILSVGGHAWLPQGSSHRGNILYMAVVRCELCGHSMMFDSEKFSTDDEPVLWNGPGPPPA
jgi:hypothetical protein